MNETALLSRYMQVESVQPVKWESLKKQQLPLIDLKKIGNLIREQNDFAPILFFDINT